MSGTCSKLRRSRRLSSTRGLRVRTSTNTNDQTIPREDLNQKLGLCPIVSGNVAGTKARPTINWELNERVSLSSGSSAGLQVRPDAKKGIELSGNRKKPDIEVNKRSANDRTSLELMNVSGYQQEEKKRKDSSWSIEIDSLERPNDENVIKSDSKYEIGTPSEGSASRKLTKQRRQLTGSSKTRKNEEECVKKVDKTNDSITKRLELIHELNQKILANYERFQQKSKSRNHSKDGQNKNPKEQPGRSRGNDGKEARKEEHVYAEARRKNKTKTDSKDETCKDSLRQRKTDVKKFAFTKEHRENVTLSKEQSDADKGRSKSRILRDNENFIMTSRPGFYDQGDKERRSASRTEYRWRKSEEKKGCKSVFYSNVEDTRNHVDGTINEDADCLGSSRLYPENYGDRFNEARSDQAKQEETETRDANGIDERRDRSVKEKRIDRVTLEEEILENLDETIGSFDNERSVMVEEKMEETTGHGFDSNDTRNGTISELTGPKVSRLQETFNSSWDSGVGVDVGTGSGWVRIHTGIESSLVYLTLDTTAKDVCRDMLLGDDLSLFIQVSELELSPLIIHLIYDAKDTRLNLMRKSDVLMSCAK